MIEARYASFSTFIYREASGLLAMRTKEGHCPICPLQRWQLRGRDAFGRFLPPCATRHGQGSRPKTLEALTSAAFTDTPRSRQGRASRYCIRYAPRLCLARVATPDGDHDRRSRRLDPDPHQIARRLGSTSGCANCPTNRTPLGSEPWPGRSSQPHAPVPQPAMVVSSAPILCADIHRALLMLQRRGLDSVLNLQHTIARAEGITQSRTSGLGQRR